MYRVTLFFLTVFAVLFTTARASKPRKNFTEIMGHIQKDNQALSEMLHNFKGNVLPQITDLAKKEVVRRCNDKLQSNLLQRLEGYSGSLSTAENQFKIYLQEYKIQFLLFIRFVRNAEWSDALATFRKLDELYSSVEAMINSCYTQVKMILDVNNGFYEENQAWGPWIVGLLALNMNEEQCQEKRPILLTASVTFGIICVFATIMEYVQQRAR